VVFMTNNKKIRNINKYFLLNFCKVLYYKYMFFNKEVNQAKLPLDPEIIMHLILFYETGEPVTRGELPSARG